MNGHPYAAAVEAAPAGSVGGVAGLKALELRSGLEGGAANSAYAVTRLRGNQYQYAYTSPPSAWVDEAAPPPPMVYVKETITTVTTTYPAGTVVPATGVPATPAATSRDELSLL